MRVCFFPNQWYRMHDNDGSLPNEGLQPLLTAPTQLHLAQTYSCRVSVYSCRAHQQTAETTFEQCVVVVVVMLSMLIFYAF